jgi:SAM-dependent methyltransferase
MAHIDGLRAGADGRLTGVCVRGAATVPSAEFTDPRLVAAYDAINPYEPGTQPDYVAAVAARIGARRIVDLGCGTGIVSCALALAGYEVIGVEPAPAMVDRARTKPGADRVRWVVGGAAAIGTPDADQAIMTCHVAQFFVTDDDWSSALTHLHAALRPEGRLVFESRNPDAREWERWDSDRRTTVHDPDAGPIETWSRVDDVRDDVVHYTLGYRFTRPGDEILVPNALRFRSEAGLRASLAAAGFTVETVHGDWDGSAVTATSPELIVTAVSR